MTEWAEPPERVCAQGLFHEPHLWDQRSGRTCVADHPDAAFCPGQGEPDMRDWCNKPEVHRSHRYVDSKAPGLLFCPGIRNVPLNTDLV